jgi:hypothetical protein
MKRNSRFLVAALLALPLMFSLGLEAAMAGSTQTGTIRGKVVDEKGQALPGVTILIRSEALVREQATVTDADGNYFMAGLPNGKYSVLAQLAGYLTIAQDTVVQVDKTTIIPDTRMREGELQETVTVTADKPIVDKTSSEKATVIEKEFTEKLPAGRNYQSLIQYAPGVTGGANPNILGGTANSNLYLIDGINGGDPVTGTFGFNLNFDAIDSVDIKLTGISAEYGQTQGGVTNLTTKTGGNEWSGSLRDVVRAPSWTNLYTNETQTTATFRRTFDPDHDPSTFNGYNKPGIPARGPSDDNKNNRISTTLGGPIVPDNAWFYLSYDRIKTNASASLGDPNGGVNGDGTYGDVFDGNFSLGKLTWQVNNDHRLQYQYSEDPAKTTRCYGQVFFGGPCYDSYTVDNQGQGGFVWVADWNATWGTNIVTDVKVAKFKNTFRITPLTPIPFRPNLPISGTGDMAPAIDLSDGTTYDANIFSADPEDREREQYEAGFTWFLDTGGIGSHTIKVGADYQKQDQIGSSIIQGNALFYFIGQGGSNVYDETNRSYLLWYDFAPPGSGGPVNRYSAVYVNDDWQLNDFLAFNIGVRAEKSVNENDLGEKIIDDFGVAPRLGVNWDITGQGKHVVRATAARFLAGINLTTLSPFVRAAGGQSSYDIYYNLDYPAPTAPGGSPNWALIAQVRPDPDTATFDENLKPQRIDEGTVAWDWAVTPTFGLGVQAIYRKWDNIITQANTYTYPDGVTPTKILQFRNNDDAKRNYKAAILRAEKRLGDNWMLMANYTWSEAKGNVTSEGGFDLFGAYPGVPQATRNREGLLPWDSTHNVKLQGFYSIPIKNPRHAVSVGAIYDYRSGNPYANFFNIPNVVVGPGADGIQDVPLGTIGSATDQVDAVNTFFEKRGTRRAPHNQQLDLALNYSFNFVKDVLFQTRFEVFNITNEQRAIAVDTNTNATGSTTASSGGWTFGYPTSYTQLQVPRAYRVQFAITW